MHDDMIRHVTSILLCIAFFNMLGLFLPSKYLSERVRNLIYTVDSQSHQRPTESETIQVSRTDNL